MNKEVIEFIKELKEKLNKRLENYELGKVFGQLSPSSIYTLFPTESKMLLDYINQLETNRDELKKILNNEVLDTLPFDVAEQVHNLFEENQIIDRFEDK